MEHVVAPLGQIHAPHNWEFADAPAREAAVIQDEEVGGVVIAAASLVGRLALQLDTGAFWRLASVEPAVWAPVRAEPTPHGHPISGVAGLASALNALSQEIDGKQPAGDYEEGGAVAQHNAALDAHEDIRQALAEHGHADLHAHENKTVLDDLGDSGGALTYKGQAVGGGGNSGPGTEVLIATASASASAHDFTLDWDAYERFELHYSFAVSARPFLFFSADNGASFLAAGEYRVTTQRWRSSSAATEGSGSNVSAGIPLTHFDPGAANPVTGRMTIRRASPTRVIAEGVTTWQFGSSQLEVYKMQGGPLNFEANAIRIAAASGQVVPAEQDIRLYGVRRA